MNVIVITAATAKNAIEALKNRADKLHETANALFVLSLQDNRHARELESLLKQTGDLNDAETAQDHTNKIG